ncbi:hypothetical protein [Pontixanthobacter aquaemixtae]|uniref:PepSY domain-containing protein n=1 Tax=Pontixanthobacter aquaemixtae TaxID=1958940 RepID=A0A844ZPK7_9SPHN|nr:hypothetical protein [Pontixanthobacter aquaemixtae]MXO89775.1 hypothetical protein [Pontixanthobacter aquaemixtae]
MVKPKTRNLLILAHLLFASFLAPMFILVAITGFNYLSGTKGETVETALTVPEGITIDAESDTIEDTVREVLTANDLPTDFEYLRMRPGSITTRPTSTDFVVLEEEEGVWSATLHEPSLQYRMMELHMGHGPEKFKIYQTIAAVALLFIILGGLLVGLLAPAYRKKTIGAAALGTATFALLAFVI